MVDDFVHLLTGRGLYLFDNSQLLINCHIDAAVCLGKTDAVSYDLLLASPTPSIFVVAHDQEQMQITSIQPLSDVAGLSIVSLYDTFHRRHNDSQAAVARSGLMKHFYGAVALVNVAYGPWETKAWWHAMVGQANNLAKGLGPDDAWLLRVWPQIVADRGLTDVPGAASRAARAAFLQDELLASKGATIHGARIAPSKWMSLHKAWSEWDAEVTLRGALILGTLANEKVHQSDCRHCLPFDTLLRIAHGRFAPSIE